MVVITFIAPRFNLRLIILMVERVFRSNRVARQIKWNGIGAALTKYGEPSVSQSVRCNGMLSCWPFTVALFVSVYQMKLKEIWVIIYNTHKHTEGHSEYA